MQETVNTALVAAREKLASKQAVLNTIMEEAKVDGGLDFSKVKSLGANMTTVAIAEKFREISKECNDLYDEAKTIADAIQESEKASGRMKSMRHTAPHDPDKKSGDPEKREIKSLGELMAGSAEFKERLSRGGDFALSFDTVMPSDVLGKGLRFKTLMTAAAGYDPWSVRLPGITEAVTRPIQLLDIVPMGQVSTDSIDYMEETTRTHAAAEKAEGDAYAESTFAGTARNVAVRKITDSITVTDEQLQDNAYVSSYLNQRLSFGVMQRLDTAVLTGSATPPAIKGIANTSGIQTQAKSSDTVMDAVRKAVGLVRVTGRSSPTHIVMHDTDWQGVEILKTTDGIYILGSPAAGTARRLWGLPVVQCEAGSAGTAYVGSFLPMHITLFERTGVDIQVGYVNTQFAEGERTIRASMRAGLVVFRPAAFCSVTGL